MLKKKDKAKPRSRIRQGSSRVPLTYYRSASAPSGDKSPFVRRNQPGRTRKFLFGTLDVLVILLMVALFIYSLIIKPEPLITATSYGYRTNEVYAQTAGGYLESFGNRNKLTVDDADIIKKLQSDFPEIKSAQLELPIISQIPKLHLEIAEPIFILKSSGQDYIISSEGIVVDKASTLPNITGLPVVDDQSNFSLNRGSAALSPSSAKFINTVWREVKNADIKAASLILPPVAMELNLRTADKPYYVKFYLGGDPALQVGQFLAAREQFQKDGTDPEQYLDVRVQGKIFYK